MAISPRDAMIAKGLVKSGKDSKEFVSCSRKTRYATVSEAIVVAMTCVPKITAKNFHKPLIYPCRFCSGFHIAHREVSAAELIGKLQTALSQATQDLAILSNNQKTMKDALDKRNEKIAELRTQLDIARCPNIQKPTPWWRRILTGHFKHQWAIRA